MERANVRELKSHASAILRRVREEGESYEITHRGKVIATLGPPVEQKGEIMTLRGLWAPYFVSVEAADLDRAIEEVRREVEADLERLAQEIATDLAPESADGG